MPKIDLVVESAVSQSIRAEQVSSMFDVPPQKKARLEWHGELPIEDREWHVGLIVGPSGSGKSTLLNSVFGKPVEHQWTGASVIDDFAPGQSVERIADICRAVGFNTIPAWLRPYDVLSTGEKFRVDMARRMLEGGAMVTCDEFTSVVDRQVARIGCHAVQKYIRKEGRQFVAAACHYDLEDWLQPDWVFEPATMQFRWRSLQRRPEIECVVTRVPYKLWRIFAPFHYISAELNPAARCFGLFVDGRIVAFLAALHRVHPTAHDVYGYSRGVTLPDFQGIGFTPALSDCVSSAFKAVGLRAHTYPAHPAHIRSRLRSPNWTLLKLPGVRNVVRGPNSTVAGMGGRPCAILEYVGPAMADREQAEALLRGNTDKVFGQRRVLV
jgi:ABC-type lipoprotein export system ATPase subunit